MSDRSLLALRDTQPTTHIPPPTTTHTHNHPFPLYVPLVEVPGLAEAVVGQGDLRVRLLRALQKRGGGRGEWGWGGMGGFMMGG